ncbi:MAG TPA: Gfo/Idh/MocA family oxidoreductase [Planctomycetaceae bacterium]|jgi:myo-inositol 2-dehydrogenase/D-chiro-inositol 1-dehydrogenase|nr:Gfo/Idh/MocA family oxidoreductase [Planctomycetaceae bacterium]
MKDPSSEVSTTSQVLSAAVIGCGRVGEWHAAALAGSGDATLVAVCDRDRERCGRLAERFWATPFDDFRELLRTVRPDVVTVATPDALHFEPVMAALESGSHVFCEKPLATRINEARTMAAEADKRQLFLGVDFNRRYGFGYRRASEMIRDGRVGTPRNATLVITDGFPPLSVRTNPTAMFTTLLTHHFDLFRWLIDEPVTVHVTGSVDPATKLVSHVVVAFRFRKGAVGTISASYREGQTRTHETMVIAGSTGSLTVEDVTRSVTAVANDPEQRESWLADPWHPVDSFWDTIRAHVRVFVTRIKCGESPEITGRDGVESLRIAAAAENSWRTGHPVEVPDE